MFRKVHFLILMIFIVILSACSEPVSVIGPKREAFKLMDKTFELKGQLELDLKVDSSNIEVYSWDKKQFKIEIKNRIRGIGEKAELEEKLKSFNINLSQTEDRITCDIKYKKRIKNPADISSDIVLFIPRKSKVVHCKVDIGTIKLLDDLETNLDFKTDMVNIDIKRLKGKLNVKGDMGSLKLENGKLKKDSSVSLNLGNIEIKSQFEEGQYEYKTGTGNIDLRLPGDSKVSFENLGTVEVNEFKEGNYPTKIKNSTDMGRITLRKY